MALILDKVELEPGRISKLLIDAPQIARKAQPGNFIVLRVSERGERIPLTIADSDPDAGTIAIVFLVMGKSTAVLDTLKKGDRLHDICGPLGNPTKIEARGTVVCVGGGTGIAALHNIAKAHKKHGNRVISILGARTESLLIMQEEFGRISDEVVISTNDGSKGVKGLVTDALALVLAEHKVGEVVAVGPVPMMRAVCEMTREPGILTTVSINSIMVDGIGMCGACRVTVGGETKFSCVDGPEFDGHLVDFDELQRRLTAFMSQERLAYDAFLNKCGLHD
ncbi:MAG: sulfide/dihydroorotate dehydrogenase-like FAD/NAD-binding protein [Desulfovibrionaceae bacterium]|nr:sulfide/dihydroorotate dehydrogenase-like FAD/NAD-binding protein [Desulfovibrionaceae bacterium]